MEETYEIINFDELYAHLLHKPFDYIDVIYNYFHSDDITWLSVWDYYNLETVFWRLYKN